MSDTGLAEDITCKSVIAPGAPFEVGVHDDVEVPPPPEVVEVVAVCWVCVVPAMLTIAEHAPAE